AGNIHLVYPLIPHVTVAIIPEPMPVIVKAIAVERTCRGGTQPQVVINLCEVGLRIRGYIGVAAYGERKLLAGLHRTIRITTDRVSPLVTNAFGHVHVTEFPLTKEFNGRLRAGIA